VQSAPITDGGRRPYHSLGWAGTPTIRTNVHLAVRRTFITPFDRGDIRDLINAMDDAVDEMHRTAKSVALFELRTFAPTMQKMASLSSNLPVSLPKRCRSCLQSASTLAT
jgi:uncharacterized protein Yka (UPF0111/DUF47 family)